MSQNKRPTADRHQHQTPSQVVDDYFLEHRAKLIELAAFLDRVDRAGNDDTGHSVNSPDTPITAPNLNQHHDYRLVALRDAIAVLTDGQPNRAQRILERLSDPTTTPRDTPGAPATGAHKPISQGTTAGPTPSSPEIQT
jgi:hypothetical protein